MTTGVGARAAVAAIALALASCSGTPAQTSATAQGAALPAGPQAPRYGIEARLRSLDSAVTGKIRLVERSDGVTLLVSAINVPEGIYRVALHENPNCSSPNGFSAGPAWAPPGTVADPRELIPVLSTNADGTAQASLFLRGVHTTGADGVSGRSVVVYAGSRVTDAVSGVRNNRVACGTFEPAQPFQL